MKEDHGEDRGEHFRKRAFYAIAIVAIIAILLYSLSANLNIVRSPVQVKTVGDISLRAVFDSSPNLNFQKVSLDELRLILSKDGGEIMIQDNALDSANLLEVELVIQKYKGSLSTFNGVITLKGTADNVYINNVGLKNQERQVSISTNNAQFKEIFMPVAHVELIDYTTSGTLTVGSKLTELSLQDEPVTITGFDGSAKVGVGFEIDGTVASVKIPEFRIEK